MSVIVTSKADLEDERWLAQQVATLGDGIEAARDIWLNWTENRNVGRFHPGMSPGEYIASLGLRLTLPEAMAALPDGSNVQIAAVAGVHDTTVMRARHAASANAEPDATPARVIGADGKSYPARVSKAVPIDPADLEEQEVTEPSEEITHLERWTVLYIERLSKYIEGVTHVEPPPYGPDGASGIVRRRHELNRRLQAVLNEVMG